MDKWTPYPIMISEVVDEAHRRGVKIPKDVNVRWALVNNIITELVARHGSFEEDRLALDMVRIWLDMMEQRVKGAERQIIEGTGEEIPIGRIDTPENLWEGGE